MSGLVYSVSIQVRIKSGGHIDDELMQREELMETSDRDTTFNFVNQVQRLVDGSPRAQDIIEEAP